MKNIEKHTYAIIMAGGAGTRFWPLSRKSNPKQLLPLSSRHESLLQASVRRLAPLIPSERIVVVTSQMLAPRVAEQLPDIPSEHILAEPVGRNTAPCIGWGTSYIQRMDPSAVIAVLPADQYVADEALYVSTLRRALDAAAQHSLVTIGIKPTAPETGYGYIEVGQALEETLYRVERFVEKPDLPKAQEYVASGRFWWNSGMFFFRADVLEAAIRTHLPELSTALLRYADAAKQGKETELVNQTYASLPNISIDHGVMEKTGNLVVVPGNFGWSDIGHFQAAWELASKDTQGNASVAKSILVNAQGCYIQAPAEKLVALIGVTDLVVIDTPDALLIMPRDQSQEVRKVVDQLNDPTYTRYT